MGRPSGNAAPGAYQPAAARLKVVWWHPGDGTDVRCGVRKISRPRRATSRARQEPEPDHPSRVDVRQPRARLHADQRPHPIGRHRPWPAPGRGAVSALHTACSDAGFRLDLLSVEDDRVAFEATRTVIRGGTWGLSALPSPRVPGTGQPRGRDGQLAETGADWDRLGLAARIGIVEPGAAYRGTAGPAVGPPAAAFRLIARLQSRKR